MLLLFIRRLLPPLEMSYALTRTMLIEVIVTVRTQEVVCAIIKRMLRMLLNRSLRFNSLRRACLQVLFYVIQLIHHLVLFAPIPTVSKYYTQAKYRAIGYTVVETV